MGLQLASLLGPVEQHNVGVTGATVGQQLAEGLA